MPFANGNECRSFLFEVKIMGGISITKILILVVLVVLLFGTKKLRGLGAAIKGFKKAMSDDDSQSKTNKDADITPTDADFAAKSIEGKPDAKAEDTKSQNKEQV